MYLAETDADILSIVRSQFHAPPPSGIGVAVSGGGDSMALLHILARCFERDNVQIHAVTVDHGLRPEVAEEIETVAELAEHLGVGHTVLEWTGWNGQGNLQSQARDARYRLIGQWARSRKLGLVALAHTSDDQAETVLMRLARSSGIDGLSGIPTRRSLHGVSVARPVLGLTRQQLRDYLTRNEVIWCEDPSNDDPKFERARARSILKSLAPLGIDVRTLTNVANYMSEAREALDWYTFLAARDFAQVDGGNLVLDLRRFRTQPQEIARRLLIQSVMWVGQSHYPPRRAAVTEAIDALRFGRGATLGGCQIMVVGRSIWICREYNAVKDIAVAPGTLWDNRWLMTGPVTQANTRICALGRDGVGQVPNWRETGRPHASLLSSPSAWVGDELVSAPLAGFENGWRAELQESEEAFFAALLSN